MLDLCRGLNRKHASPRRFGIQDSPATIGVFVPFKVVDGPWLVTAMLAFTLGKVEELRKERLEEWVEFWCVVAVRDGLEEQSLLDGRGVVDDVFPDMADALGVEQIAE